MTGVQTCALPILIKPDLLPSEIINSFNLDNEYIPINKLELQEYKREKTESILMEIEYKFLTQLLQSTSGNISKAAEISGYDRRQIQNLIKKHDIDILKFKS